MLSVLFPTKSQSQTFDNLWNRENEAESKDLPRTQMDVLRRIEQKASQEKAYGQLLKAQLKRVAVLVQVSPDSLKPAVAELQNAEKAATDAVIKAVYDAVLYRIYTGNAASLDSAEAYASRYRAAAMSNPQALSASSASDFDPFVVKGYNASVFGGDMLSVVGYEVEDFHTLWKWYREAGMRSAACITGLELLRKHRPSGSHGLKKSEYIRSLDSITHVYSDIDIACEAAIERYNFMTECHDVTVEDKIKYIHYALDKWGNWQGSSKLRNAEKELTCASFSAHLAEKMWLPGETQTLKLERLRNISSLTVRIYSVATTARKQWDVSSKTNYKALKPLLTELPDRKLTRTYVANPPYLFFEDSVTLGTLPAGVYMMEVETSPATAVERSLFYVSNVFCMAQKLPGDKLRLVALNATDGKPLKGASIHIFSARASDGAQPLAKLTCNDDGEALYDVSNRQRLQVYAFTDADKASLPLYVYGKFNYYENRKVRQSVRVFTDRSIYRPGQTVRVSALVYDNVSPTQYNTVAKATVKLALRNAVFKTVAERELVTDEFGACSTEFTLPADMLSGNFFIVTDTETKTLRVEEYKRPTFEVDFPDINTKYHSGDTLMVRAKAHTFAGVPVQGAKVKYKVNRRPSLWWRYAAYGNAIAQREETVASRETVTDADGTFVVEIPMVLPEEIGVMPMFYNFVVEADVTDVGGETRNAVMSVPLGSRATAFSCDLPEKVLADSLKSVTFRLRNMAGMDISTDVNFSIDGKPIATAAHTGIPFMLPERLASGRHRLHAVCDSDTIDREFTVFGLDDTVPAVETDDWFYLSSSQFPADGTPVTLQVGSSAAGMHIVYSIISGNRVVEKGSVETSNSLINRKFTYSDDYADGIAVTYAWVKNGTCHTHTATVSRPMPDRRLQLKWQTFRDRLMPGQKEEWTLSVSTPDGKPASARLIASLYDKSLDMIKSNDWNFSINPSLNIPYVSWNTTPNMILYISATQNFKYLLYKDFAPSRMDGTLFPMADLSRKLFYTLDYKSRGMMMMKEKSVSSAAPAAGAVAANKMEDKAEVVEESSYEAADASSSADGGVQMRENLNETAFFFPEAHTDKSGNVTLKFTLPESLTTWRFLGFAHTADMKYGSLTAEAVASKELMVLPNVPRFVRRGDKMQITARIFNTGTASDAGKARLQLLDPETEKVVCSVEQPFSVNAGETHVVTFECQPPRARTLYICRVTATGKKFSDGEQHYLPVLPDKETVIVTAPFSQTEAGTKTIALNELFPKNVEKSALTIEYTNNPAWLMLQALPSVGTPDGENAVSLASALYANGVAAAITAGNAKLKSVFEQWKREASDAVSLTSSLARNSELKDIVLAETPWAVDSDSETEQKQRLADFFDTNTIAARLSALSSKLASLQNADGSWSWWKGMEGSMTMTTEVSQMLVRLNVMAGKNQSTASMLDRAFKYMGRQLVSDVKKMKAEEKRGVKPSFPGTTALRFLYMSVLDGRKQSAEVQAASKYLIGLLKKEIGSQSIYDKAVTAVVLAGNGETVKSREYVKSLKEYTVNDETIGRYYDTRRAAYSWCDYRIPTQVAAIEAIAKITPDDAATITEMRRWLLQEKRTQAWDTPISSVNAVYAFLNGNMSVLDTKENVKVTIDGRKLNLPGATAGMGYVKTSVDEPTGKKLTFTKTSEGTSWGAVYARFVQNTAEIETSSAGISIKKEIISSDKELAVGSRITVRITIEAAHDLDFVQIADRRAACMEPVSQLSGYRNGAYCSPKDNATYYYFNRMPKGKHVVETQYYIDRAGTYATGTCTAGCAYAPEYRATAKSDTIIVKQ